MKKGTEPCRPVPFKGVNSEHLKHLVYFFYPVLKLLDTQQGNKIRNAHGNDTQADERGKGGSRNVRIPQAQDAQDYAADAQQQDAPPAGEANPLIVETVNHNDYALNGNPHGKDDREGECQENIVGQEDNANDYFQDGRQGPRAAVGQEGLRAKGEHQFGNTGEQREQADEPGRCEKGCGGSGNAENAQDHQQDTSNGQPDFSTSFHV